MPRNVEIKARLKSIPALLPRVAVLAASGPDVFTQDDTFFYCTTGRLKLRKFSANSGELIFYRRADESGPKVSFYQRVPTSEPDALRETLILAYGEAGRVQKERTLYHIGRTRVHLDRVAGLGEFLELEVVLREEETLAAGQQEASALLQQLGIEPSQLVERAYVDLLHD